MASRGHASDVPGLFAIPDIVRHNHPEVLVSGLLISIIFALLGSIKISLAAARLEPAEAMHPTPPEKGGRIVVERVKPLWNKFSFRWKMSLRSIFRNPFRSLVSIGAAAIAAALLLSAVSLYDGLVYLMNYHFQKLAHEDYSIALRDPLSIESQEEIRQLPTVSMDESQLVVACDFRNGSVSKRTPLLPLFHDSLRYFSLWKSE